MQSLSLTSRTVARRSAKALTLAALTLAAVHGAWAQTTAKRFYDSQLFNYQTLRAFNHIPAGGADTSEMLVTIPTIKDSDTESWYAGWRGLANRTAQRALLMQQDSRSKGLAYLRAHNYYRTAEFMLPTADSRRLDAARNATSNFYMGLDQLGVRYQRISVPYDNGAHLNAVYFPGDAFSRKPLIVMVGGFDSTMEELYFFLAKEARERGYPVLMYEGPGQGNVLREQGLRFTTQWERPTKAVLDTFLSSNAKPSSIVLLGVSMGGYFAPRAAAFDSRINGVVSFGVFYDGKEIASQGLPSSVVQLLDSGTTYDAYVNQLIDQAAALDVGLKWKLENAKWTMGVQTPAQVYREFGKYTLAPVAARITQDVLLMHGTKDHFVPATQVSTFKAALTSARSVTTKVYDETFGGHEHCQVGASTLWQADLFDWLRQRFPS